MIFADLSDELKGILTEVFKIDESAKLIPIFDKASVETIFWKLVAFNDRRVARELAEELSAFVSSLSRPEDQLLVTAEIKRPAARITESDIQLIANLSLTEQIFLEKLELQDKSPKVIIGLLIFSAIRFGGLLNKFNVEQFFHKLSNGELPRVINSTAWYTFKHDVAGNVIWLPDPLTLGLLNQWARCLKTEVMCEASTNKHVWFRYINELISKHERRKLNWRQSSFLDACRTRLSMDIAPALVDIAAGKTPTCALNPHSWLRLLTEKSPPITLEPGQHKKDQKRTTPMPLSHLRTSFDAEIIKRVDVICKRATAKNARQCVDAIREEHELFASKLSANTNLLLEWMVYRILNEGSWSGPMKISSAQNRFGMLQRAFRTHDRQGDILTLTEDDISELYETMIESYPEKRKVSVARAIRDFHDFLVRQYDIEPNYVTDKYVLADSRKNKALSVDAEVIMPWDYAYLKDYLEKVATSPEHKDFVNLVLATLIIGYRTGMRRSEIQFLRVSDFYLSDERPEETEIIVQEHSLRNLKSASAYRRLKIGVLCAPKELQFITQLVRDRESLDGKSAFVFRSLNCERPYISGKKLFDTLTRLLKQVTGNPLIRFHHLRHSNATWNILRWWAPSSGKHSGVPSLIKRIDFQKVAAERRQIIGVKDGLAPSRKTLHALSMMIGHSEPATTIRHYIHSSHITLHDQLCLVQPKLKKRVLADLAGQSSRALLKTLTKQKNDGYDLGDDEFKAISIRDKCLAALEAQQEKIIDTKGWRKKTALNLTFSNIEPSGERMELIDYYLATQDYFEGYDNIEWLENRYAVFGEKLSKVIDKANTLFSLNMRVRKGNGSISRPRHWQEMTTELVDASTGEILEKKEYEKKLPNPPRQIRERITLENMLVAAQSLTQKQKSVLAKGLEIFVHNSNRYENGIEFKDNLLLKEFVSAIRLLELHAITETGKSAERLRLTITAPSLQASDEDLEKLKQYWNKSIKFKRYQLHFRKKNLGKSYINGLAEIDLLSVEAKTSTEESSKRRIADAGFRVGLYMLYVTQTIWHS